jgi:hypothetical protein
MAGDCDCFVNILLLLFGNKQRLLEQNLLDEFIHETPQDRAHHNNAGS